MHGEKGNGIVTIRKKSFVLVLAIAFFVGMSATMGGILLIENGIVGGTVKLSKKEYSYYQQLDQRYSKLNQLYNEVTDNFYKKPMKKTWRPVCTKD